VFFPFLSQVSLSKAKIRAGSAMDSAAVGELQKGEELTVLELAWIDIGGKGGKGGGKLLRVRHARGEDEMPCGTHAALKPIFCLRFFPSLSWQDSSAVFQRNERSCVRACACIRNAQAGQALALPGQVANFSRYRTEKKRASLDLVF